MSRVLLRRAILALALLVGGPVAATATDYEARVVRVFDGDTVWVQPDGGGRWRKLRLDGIDAPEICQAGGLEARDALAGRSLGRRVQVDERARDDYGRGIARLMLDGDDLNRWLVRQGLAWAQRWRGQGAYVVEEDRARERREGLFADAGAELPRDFRRRHGPCRPIPPALSAVP